MFNLITRLFVAGCCIQVAAVSVASNLVPVEDLGLRIAPEFSISLYADADLANDIYCMTLDSQGRVVVSGAGYIQTLHDTDHDGRADSASLFATPKTGAMGLCFDGTDLYAAAEGALLRYRDHDGNGIADGPPERLFSAAFVEHGGHAIRKGPDGFFYFIGGNDSDWEEISPKLSRSGSPLPTNRPGARAPRPRTIALPEGDSPQAGALVRLSPDAKQTEFIAHGFRNPYDFDFNTAGDLFTYDSDVESDFFLPWYTPTRVFHIGYGGHHGWQLDGWRRSWNRPAHYLDSVDVLSTLGRGSPTGVVVYRHTQFPFHYRDGLFALDWTFGKIYFLKLRADGTSYRAEPELFLEPIGTHGFAPNDAVVAPDGSLLISIGGRKTRGAVYRIQHSSAIQRVEQKPTRRRYRPPAEKSVSQLLADVLKAPQPLDAWSRAKWIPIAQQLGPQPFKTAVVDEKMRVPQRVRAIEIVTELFGGLETPRAMVAAQAAAPQVRARVAWSLGRVPCDDLGLVLLPLAGDPHLLVRRTALEALLDHVDKVDPTAIARVLSDSFKHRDKRVRHAAAQLAARLPEPGWNHLSQQSEKFGFQARLTWHLAALWRNRTLPLPGAESAAISGAVSVLNGTANAELHLDAIRLLMLALGDWNLHAPSVELYTGYEFPPSATAPPRPTIDSIRDALLERFPSGDPLVDAEAARLIGMLGDPRPEWIGKLIDQISPTTSPTSDFHFLIILSQLEGSRTKAATEKIARTLLNLDDKLGGGEKRNKQNWTLRLAELATALAKRDPLLGTELLSQPDFARPDHIVFVATLRPEQRVEAARRFKAVAENNSDLEWTPALIDLLGYLPAPEPFQLLRSQWSNYGLRDPILLQLAKQPDLLDSEKFVAGLESPQTDVVQACLNALLVLPPDPRPENLVPVMRLLDRLLSMPEQTALRQSTIDLINRQTTQNFTIAESEKSPAKLRTTYQPVFDWFRRQHPNQPLNSQAADINHLLESLRSVDWNSGNAVRGEEIYRARACHTCHSSSSSIGPDLAGVTSRMSLEDLFIAIADPNRDIAPPYRTTTFQTRDGSTHTGIIAFESADGVILQTSPSTTVRLATSEITSRHPTAGSLMPASLLNDLTPSALADLYAFLRNASSR